jgi:hypothetical protein
MSVFKKLSEIDIKSKVEKKGNQSYLSWSHAWSIVKQHYPDIQRTVYEDPSTGLNYFTDGRTAYVKVGVTVEGVEHIDYLPAMDFKNQSINIDKLTSMDINKTIQRSTTKAIALHGLGISLYSGEDLVSTSKEMKPTGPIELKIGDPNWDRVLKYISDNKQLGLAVIVKNLQAKYVISTVVKKELGKYVI